MANDDLRRAIAAIDRVHGVGELPPIPLVLSEPLVDATGKSVDGLFSMDDLPNGHLMAQSIQVRSGATHRPFVALHEIGHFIDLHGLPGPRFASADTTVEALAAWRTAVLQSRAVSTLIGIAETGEADLLRRAERLLVVEELWARGYA